MLPLASIFGLDAWLFWFLLAMGLIVVELLVAFTMYFGAIAPAALLACGVALLGGGIELQLAAFAIGAALSLVFIRPIARRHLIIDDKVKVGAQLLVGKRALVIDDVTVDSGRVKIADQTWSARITDEDGLIPAGTRANVLEFRGVMAIIAEDEPPEAEPPAA